MSVSSAKIAGMSKRMKIAQEKKEMEAAGYRLIQVWVPDYSNPNYKGPRPADDVYVVGEAKGDLQAWIDGHIDETLADMSDDDWSFLGLDLTEQSSAKTPESS
ncbi:unannotated protein [freshwater metagenome]|jgi:hypothetical protein|uniref:Unannotated protein n=1 Tax=freshwater metagenome TaxID=449393 RepID=A0A6J6D7Z3_9ZZZZ|nr:DUF3018 family protein [Actinomycetota bacterium]